MVSFLSAQGSKINSGKTILLSSSTRGVDFLLKNDAFILFRPRFEAYRFDTSILFRTRFEVDLDLLILLSSFARGSKMIFKHWFAHLTWTYT